jgi:hypothetical protein
MTHEDARSGTTLSWPNAAGAGAGCHGFFIARAGRDKDEDEDAGAGVLLIAARARAHMAADGLRASAAGRDQRAY